MRLCRAQIPLCLTCSLRSPVMTILPLTMIGPLGRQIVEAKTTWRTVATTES